MKYQTIPVPVDAVQFKKDEPWPPGVYKHAWNVGPGDRDGDLPTVTIGSWQSNDRMWLTDGDWIITYPSGLVLVERDVDFKKKFEVVPAEAKTS